MWKRPDCSAARRPPRNDSGNTELAKELGAATAVIADADVAMSVIDTRAATTCRSWSSAAIRRGACGRGNDPAVRSWRCWRRYRSHRDRAVDGAAQTGDAGTSSRPAIPVRRPATGVSSKQLRYLWASLACAAVTLLSIPLAEQFDRSNIVAIFITDRRAGCRSFGRGAAALAAVLACVLDFSSFRRDFPSR